MTIIELIDHLCLYFTISLTVVIFCFFVFKPLIIYYLFEYDENEKEGRK